MEAGLVIRIQLEPQWVGHSGSHGKTDPYNTYTLTHTHTRTYKPTNTLTFCIFYLQISLQETEYKCRHLLQAELTFLASHLPLLSFFLPCPAAEFWVAPSGYPTTSFSQYTSPLSRAASALLAPPPFPVNFMFRCVLRQLILLPNICVGRPANLELGTCSCPHVRTHTQ